jgi:hypothetical protein
MDVETLTEGTVARRRRAARAVVLSLLAAACTVTWLVTASLLGLGLVPTPAPIPAPTFPVVALGAAIGALCAGIAALVAVDQDQAGTWIRWAGGLELLASLATCLFWGSLALYDWWT